MNEEWREMMSYAPLIEEEVDTDYQKVEDFTVLEQKTVGSQEDFIMPMVAEDFFGADSSADDLKMLEQKSVGAEEDFILPAVAEDFLGADDVDDFSDVGDAYDDYQTIPDVSMDIYSGEEY